MTLEIKLFDQLIRTMSEGVTHVEARVRMQSVCKSVPLRMRRSNKTAIVLFTTCNEGGVVEFIVKKDENAVFSNDVHIEMSSKTFTDMFDYAEVPSLKDTDEKFQFSRVDDESRRFVEAIETYLNNAQTPPVPSKTKQAGKASTKLVAKPARVSNVKSPAQSPAKAVSSSVVIWQPDALIRQDSGPDCYKFEKLHSAIQECKFCIYTMGLRRGGGRAPTKHSCGQTEDELGYMYDNFSNKRFEVRVSDPELPQFPPVTMNQDKDHDMKQGRETKKRRLNNPNSLNMTNYMLSPDQYETMKNELDAIQKSVDNLRKFMNTHIPPAKADALE